MNQMKKDFLSLNLKPARLNISETAWLLGFGDNDIAVLISNKLLKPLGHPTQSGSKYFAVIEIESLRNDLRWLAKASDTIVNHWRVKNASRKLPAALPLSQ